MKTSQYTTLEKLLTRRSGVTAMEIIEKCKTTCPHKRMSELKGRGWNIRREPVKGKSHGKYFGVKPA